MWETQVQSLGQEELLEKEMATHSSILAWKTQWMEKPGRLQSMDTELSTELDTTSLSLSSPEELVLPCINSQSAYGHPTGAQPLTACL